jgi:hypothetical protein
MAMPAMAPVERPLPPPEATGSVSLVSAGGAVAVLGGTLVLLVLVGVYGSWVEEAVASAGQASPGLSWNDEF